MHLPSDLPGDTSIKAALASIRRSINDAPEENSEDKWSFSFFGLKVTLPNFSWRKEAIDKHDLHHLILDIPFSMAGECQVATWEFASGPHPDKRAQLFCLPLVSLGCLIAPRRTWRSFVKGVNCRSLYSHEAIEIETLGDARRFVLCRPERSKRPILKLLGLMLASVLLVVTLPIVATLILYISLL